VPGERATTEALLGRHPGAWRTATRHPFLDGVRDGTLPAGAFATWLGQDRLFVEDLLRFQARLLARAPRGAQAVLAAGLVALEAELGWFEQQASARGLALPSARHPTTEAYRRFMDALEARPFAAALVALWALERAYMEAWSAARPGAEPYREFVAHWTVPEFGDYVAGLAAAADRALGEDATGAEAAFLETARLEGEFWAMAWSG
jgi:thiaminase/transcriptional activator TenA